MDLAELQLDRQLYRTQPQTAEVLGASDVAANLTPPPSTAIASGNSVTDVNTNAETINGAAITPGSIPPTSLNIANWGWTQTCVFSVTDADTVSWGSGNFASANGASSYSISAGNTGNMSFKTYVYLDINVSTTAYQISTNVDAPIGPGKVLIAVCDAGSPGATYNLVQAHQIVGDNVLANTIDANKIVAGSITATQISASYVYAGFLSANQINTGTLTAINITGSVITGSTLTTASSGQRVLIQTNDIAFYDSSNNFGGQVFGDTGGILVTGGASSSGIVLHAGSSGAVAFGYGTTNVIFVDSTGMYPNSDNTYDSANQVRQWKNVWLKGILEYRGIDQPITYFGYCSGTTISESNNPGWTLSNPSTGKYTITHNLGTTNYTMVATTVRGSGAGAYVCKVESRNSNDIKVTVFDDTGTVQNGDFMFNLTKVA